MSVVEAHAAGLPRLPEEFRMGWAFALLVLDPLSTLLLPAVLLAVLSASVAREAESGTIDEILARPVSRRSLVLAKLAAGLVYLALMVCVAAFVSIVVAPLVLGGGKVFTGMPADEAGRLVPVGLDGWRAATRVALAYAAAAAALASVAALAVVVSAAASDARKATLIAVGVYFGLAGLAGTRGLESLRPYTVFHYLSVWEAFVGADIDWMRLLKGAGILAAAFALLAVGAALLFGGREFPPRS